MRTTCGHPRRQPRAGTRNAPVDPAPPPSAGARARARVSSGVSYGESNATYLPVAEGRSRTGIRDVTILFDTVATLCQGATYDLGTALGPAAMLARPAAVYRRTGTTHRLMCRCERGDGRTRPLTFSDYPLPSTDARASKLFMLRARVAAHRAAARLLLLRVTSPSRGPRSMWEVHLAPRAAAAIAGPPGLRLPRAQSR